MSTWFHLKRAVALLAFYGVARHMPASHAPGGSLFRMIRVWSAAGFCDSVHPSANIERGCYLGRGAGISVGARAGIGVNCRIHGPVRIGRDVMMGPDCVVLAMSHGIDLDVPMLEQPSKRFPVVIGDGVWIGTRAIILADVEIGAESIIGAGAIVSRSIEKRKVVVGAAVRVLDRK